MSTFVFDCEANGLIGEADTIHVLAYTKIGSDKICYTHDYDEMREFLLGAKTLIAHNCVTYDIPLLERILKIKIKARLIDTLALSWYLNHKRIKHGLEEYGEEYGVPKPKINDWDNLSLKEYAHRCVEDVKINKKLWNRLRKKLLNLYQNKKGQAGKLIDYLTFKMTCARLQEESKWRLDKALAQKMVEQLSAEKEAKVEELKQHMPQVPKYAKRTKPTKPYTKSGEVSVAGARWFALLKEQGLPKDYVGEVKAVVRYDDPKPTSPEQVKAWLFSMGWEPENYKYVRNKETNEERKIPQVRIDGDEGKELCPSVKRLADKFPAISILDGFTVVSHRLTVFQGFLEDERDGFVVARIAGFTNTLRFKHKTIVNLPGVDKAFGMEIRGSLIARDGYELCGSDMVSLEDTTKRHYMWDYDPEYVTEMSKPGFDPHLDLAKFAGACTQKEIDDYVGKVPGAKNLKPIRKNFKAANYACVYGVMKKTLSRQTGLTQTKSQELINIYWKRNWSVQAVSNNTVWKKVDGEMWLLNPISGFWYSLRYEKDIFSTLNQGTGVYCFDSWLREVIKRRPQITGQFHDEGIWEIKKGHRKDMTKVLRDSIKAVNDRLKLNVKLDIDVQFGDTYAEIH